MYSKRERVMAALSGEKPDRPPIFECVAHDGVLEHFGGQRVAPGDRAGVLRACAEFLDLCHPALVPNEPKVIDHDDGTRTTVERWTTWSPLRTLDPEDVPRLLAEQIEQADAWRVDEAGIAEGRAQMREVDTLCGDMVYIHVGTNSPICPFDFAHGFYALTDHPDLTRRWNKAVNDRALRQIDALVHADLVPVCILWNDIAAKGGLIYPPAMLDELFYPHLRRQIELLHSRGVKALFHCDGDAIKALPALIDCGIDGFNPLEITAGMTADRFLEICGDRVALVGGIDAVDVLARGTVDQVVAETKRLLDLFADTGNLIVASSSGQIDDSMPTENVRAMYETVWEHGAH